MLEQFISTLEQFISTLERAKIERQGEALDAVAIADLLWLALHRGGGESIEGEAGSVVGDEPELAAEVPEAQPAPTQRETEETLETEATETAGAKVYPSGGRSQSSQQGIPFKTPAAAALRNPLALARALRPLMRKAPSRTVQVLDEQATVQQSIEERRVVPVLRPALERWFEVALVIEESGSWGIWQQTLLEFAQLLARQGAFRAVQVWWARVDGDAIKLRSGNGRVVRPQVLADPTGRRLVLLASDCTSAAWSDGTWLGFLRQWGARVSVTVLQLLPEVMWRQTALGQSEGVQLGATVPGAVNTRLRLERETWWLEEGELPTPDLVPVPVISLEPYGLRAWARVMAGVAQARLAGYGLAAFDGEALAVETAVLELDGEELFERFWATASPLARRLAALMAATSVQLPIVRLIQQVMVPRSSTVQVAEVFLSGMLEVVTRDVADPERRRYEFVAGVRELLLGTIPRWEALTVVEQVSGFVARRLGVSLREFEGMILGEGNGELDEDVRAFAEVTEAVLERLGYINSNPKNKSRTTNQVLSRILPRIENRRKQRTRKIALLIGVSEYQEFLVDLPGVINDIAAMKEILEDPEIGGFDDVEVLVNPERQSMKHSVVDLFLGCQKEDIIVFYFSGHAYRGSDPGLFLVASDTTSLLDKAINFATALSDVFIKELALKCRSEKIVFILDCSNSAAFMEDLISPETGQPVHKDFMSKKNFAFLGSSGKFEVSFQDEYMSLFTRDLVDGIRTGKVNSNQGAYISVGDLIEFISEEWRKKQRNGYYTVTGRGHEISLFRVPEESKFISKQENNDEFPINALNNESITELDKILLSLVLEAQRHPVQSRERRRALDRLFRLIHNSGQLSKPFGQYPSSLYQEIYSDAIQRLFSFITQEIERYNPERSRVIAWANYLLKVRFFPEAQQSFRRVKKSNYKQSESSRVNVITSPKDRHQTKSSLSNQLKIYFEADPDKILKKICIRNRPDVTFQFVALKVLDGCKWRELSEEINVSVSTLSAFYNRNLKKLTPQIQAYLNTQD
ncbi:MAG: caspase family protein [Spirulina sp. SIO3F2]|nr:caspase family protein [Spirulina sp. SIO3F2]